MGGWNTRTPYLAGMEWQPSQLRVARFAAPNRSLQQRFPAPSTAAPVSVGQYFSRIEGRTPGIAVEIVEDRIPTVVYKDYFLGTDTGFPTGSWTRSTGAGTWFSHVDDYGGSDSLYNAVAQNRSAILYLYGHCTGSALTAESRIVRVEAWASVYYVQHVLNERQIRVYGALNRAGTWYQHPGGDLASALSQVQTLKVGSWDLDPSTGVPWTVTNLNRLIDNTNDYLGLFITGARLGFAGAFYVFGTWLRVYTCEENRFGSFYTPSGGYVAGWNELTLSNTKAMTQGALYRYTISALTGAPGSYFEVPVLGDPWQYQAPTPAQTYGEQRQVLENTLTGAGGVILDERGTVGEQIPMLVDNGSIIAQSQPYVAIDDIWCADWIGGVRCDGSSGCYVSTPDSAVLEFATPSNFAFEVSFALDDYTNGTQTVFAKWTTAPNLAYKLEVNSSGFLVLTWSTDGTTTASATVATTTLHSLAAHGARVRVRGSLTISSGATVFQFFDEATGLWTTPAGWTPAAVGATQVYGGGNAALEIGAQGGGATNRATGTFYYLTLYSDTTFTQARTRLALIVDANFAPTLAAKRVDTTISDLAGLTYTLNGTATWSEYVLVQEITTPAATYAGVVLNVGWATGAPPTSELIVELQEGLNAHQGRGTVRAVAYVRPEEVDSRPWRPVFARFSTAYATSAQQYYVVVRTGSSPGRPWSLPRLDTRSDALPAGSLVTAAEINGATQGGTTDRAVAVGGMLSRSDYAMCLAQGPAAVSGVAVAARAAL